MSDGQSMPVVVMPEGSSRDQGKPARSHNIFVAKTISDLIKSTLGPKGMDKLMLDALGDITVTNDGVTILRELNAQNPIAKMIIEVAKTQEAEVGDGTTTAVILAGELLAEAELLMKKNIHPTVIARGYKLAAQYAIKSLDKLKFECKDADLVKVASTAMTGKGAENEKEFLAELVVKAIKGIKEASGIDLVTVNDVRVRSKAGGSVTDSLIIMGAVIDKERAHPHMPKRVEKAKILVLEDEMDLKLPNIDAKISIADPKMIPEFMAMEDNMLREQVNKVISTGVKVIVCSKNIDDVAVHMLAEAGIYALRKVWKEDLQMLSKATGATVVGNIQDLRPEHLGVAEVVEERRVGNVNMTFVEGCADPKGATILIRGSTDHFISEIKRAVEDAIGDITNVVNEKFVVAGAGSVEMALAKELRSFASGLTGRQQLAVKAFANVMESIPATLAENAGLDPIDIMTELVAEHEKGNVRAGVDVFNGKVMDAYEAGVVEPLKVKTQAISSAAEVAVMILRIDDVISTSRNPRQPPAGATQ